MVEKKKFDELFAEGPAGRGGGKSGWDEEAIREFLEYVKSMGKKTVYIDTKKFFDEFKKAGKGYKEIKYPGWTARKVLLKFAEEFGIKDVVGGNKVLEIHF